MKARIYEIASEGSVYLVKATTVNQAIRYITDKTIIGLVASQDRLVELVHEGVTVLDATVVPKEEKPESCRHDYFDRVADTTEQTTINTGEIF